MNGQINTREGVSSISDKATGQLLFYSEGTTVWNRNHAIMPNGTGLQGDYSSTQSSIIVPNPGNPNQYYLFTTALSQGVRYSVIDMTLAGGLGDVIAATKNTSLITPAASSEKLIAVQHCNKTDFWVITHTLNSNTFYVYLVNATGVQAPVTYNIGYSIGNAVYWEGAGYLKFSPDGSKLVHVIGPANTGALSRAEILSFNNKTGIVSGPVTVLDNLNSPYGAEFSQSNKYLYISELLGKRLLQYDLTAPNINASQYTITNSANLLFGALQLGPDNKIYVSAENGYNIGYGYLGVINNPEASGAGCGYIQDAINLNGKATLIGLPTFNATYLQKDTASVQLSGSCAGIGITFSLTNTNNADSVKWSFGDASDSSMLLNPVHTYATPAVYNTRVVIYRSCNVNDTINKAITITNCNQSTVIAGFTAPDTVCINNPVTINNTSTGATTSFWNFCVADINQQIPIGNNMGNVGGNLAMPVFMDYVFANNNYYGFSVNFNGGGLIRHDFGNSLLNTPTTVNLGNFGGVIPAVNSAEGIQVVQNEGRWYAIIVGGYTGGPTPRVLKVDFGPNITNPTPVATSWGNIGGMDQPVDLHVFKENNNWYGFTVNAEDNSITRFDFTNSFNNIPTGTNLGNIGNLAYPTGIYAINNNGNWSVFITNAGDNTRSSGTFSLSRLDFGSSLLNTPVGVNLGSLGNVLQHPRDLTILRSCEQIIGFVVNGHLNDRSLVKLDFNNNLSATPIATSLGNIGNLSFPHSISKLFRVNEDIYGFITNVDNNTITRLRFPGCTNASIASSTATNPPPVTYNTPGTYNINLTVDDGLPTQSAFCKQVVVLPEPVSAPTQRLTLCAGTSNIRIGTGSGSATYLWNTGATTDSIDVTAPGTYWVDINRFGCTATDTFIINASSCIVTAAFTAPDTVCINNPVTINNTSTGATTSFWNFCVADITQPPVGTNLGNIDNNLSQPVFMDYVFDNGNYYGFVVNHIPGGLVRLNFGNSLLNTPTSVNLGNFNGVIPAGSGAEGIRVVKNNGKWYAIIVGGSSQTTYPPRILKIDFGANITNPSPTATDWGNLGNMDQPIDFDLFQENNNWYGFTVNAINNTITRFNFTNSFDNTPTAINMGNLGGLSYPTGIYIINDNGNYRIFISNAGSGASLTRLDFGSSLLNTPTAVNLGNPGNVMVTPRDLTVMRSCGQAVAFIANGQPGYGNISSLDFNNDFTAVPTPASLGNIGNLNFAHSISRLFRVNEDIFGFVTNVTNNTITRFRFPGCTNASIASSTATNPPPITYNTPGTYNINLTVDDGLPTQTAFCKQVVVLPAPVQSPTKTSTLCTGATTRIGTGAKYATYLWNTGATTDSIDVTNAGTYWVTINSFGCSVTDTFKVERILISDFSFKQDVCNPYTVTFANASTATTSPYWDLGDGTMITGNLNPVHTYANFGDYTIRFSVQDGNCRDTVDKIISINVVKDDIIITPDTVICDGTTKQLRTKPSLSFCWYPTTYLDNPNSPNPVTSTPHNITYYFNAEVTGNNLIVNGDFSAGNTGFTSQYIYAATNTTEGEYAVGPNPQTWNGAASNCRDHTSGNGNMLLVNGNPIADEKVWTQTVNVIPNTSYAFSTWIQSISEANPAQLQFSINGKDMANAITASMPGCNWLQFYTTWNSGNNTTAQISIVNKNTIRDGNDFALDDISFAQVFIKRDSVIIKVDTPVVKTILDTTVCKEKPVTLYTTGAATYTWSPATTLSNPAIANPVATPSANTEYIVTGITMNGCVAKDTVAVNIFSKPVITKTQDTAVCRNSAFPLYIAGGTSYAWSPANQLNNPASNTPIASPGTADITYYVTITDSHSCISQDSVQVSIRPYPVFTASGNQAICYGSSATLRAGGGDQYQWTPAHLLSDAGSPEPVATPDTTTQFSVYIRETTCGFDTTINRRIIVNPVPELTVEKANDINCNTPTAQLNAAGARQYTWSPVAGLNDPYKANPITHTDTTTQYTVTGINQYGCSSTAFLKVIASKEGLPRFVVPNAFTPNGDRNNDCFGIQRWGNAKVEEFAVYNRWGQLVFKTADPSRCWDGTFNGKPQDAGGYIYVIKAKTLCGEVSRKGMVMLIR
ncbi:T9SS type B sorting domain-containing protein [Pseudoflavitalea sp. X16]|uniref:PKD domain-containing protein n=1 Tax=Paraflavitalea devenefica TaxID=2716334 RepID=UPI0014208A23|nr:PKD domain-containing protein [Paraflavitalea devenefica]NII29560.1 T9SS type B sorting domain-containing protein [Paraflavitalea devenefica]